MNMLTTPWYQTKRTTRCVSLGYQLAIHLMFNRPAEWERRCKWYVANLSRSDRSNHFRQ